MPAAKNTTKEVTRDDQNKINLFARTHRLLKEQKSELESMKEKLNNLNDGIDDLELHDEELDGKVPVMVGDIFVLQTVEGAQEIMTRSKNILQDKISKTSTELDETQKKLDGLKSSLYSKFGNEINLEE